MHIREALPSDLPVILEIMNEAIRNTTAIYDYGERTPEFAAQWLRQKNADKFPVLVCQVDGQLVAYGSYGIFRPWDGFQFSVEHSIYVHVGHQGMGIGKQLLEALIDRATEDGFHVMIAGIDASNEASCRFHARFGFEETGRMKEVGYKFDRWLDLVFMQRILIAEELLP